MWFYTAWAASRTALHGKRSMAKLVDTAKLCNKSVLCILFKVFKCLLDPWLNHRHYKVEPFNTKINLQSKIPLQEKALHCNRTDNNSFTCNGIYEMFDDKQKFFASLHLDPMHCCLCACEWICSVGHRVPPDKMHLYL